MPSEHKFKTDPEPFREMWDKRKTADYRNLSDRPAVAVGDKVIFEEHDPAIPFYTGKSIVGEVTHVQTGYGIPVGSAIISFRVLKFKVK